MESSQQKTFVVSRSFRKQMLLAFASCIVLAVIGVAALYFQNKWTLWAVLPFLGITILSCGAALFFLWPLLSLSKSSVGVDDDGLWLLHVGKECRLVPWDAIRDVRERHLHQRLELLGDGQKVLIKLEYQLDGFEELPSLVASRMLGGDELGIYPATFSTPWREHSSGLGMALFFSVISIASLYFNQPFLAMYTAPAVLIILASHAVTPYRLVVHEHHLEIRSLVSSRRIQRDEVDSVALTTRSVKGFISLFVLMELKDGRKVLPYVLGCSTIRLSRALMVWKYLPDEVGIEQ